MTKLEKLAIQMAANWHEQERLIAILQDDNEPKENILFTEIKLDQLCALMTYEKEQVFEILNEKVNSNHE